MVSNTGASPRFAGPRFSIGFQFCQTGDCVKVIDPSSRFPGNFFTLLWKVPDFSLGLTPPSTISNPERDPALPSQSSWESMVQESAAVARGEPNPSTPQAAMSLKNFMTPI